MEEDETDEPPKNRCSDNSTASLADIHQLLDQYGPTGATGAKAAEQGIYDWVSQDHQLWDSIVENREWQEDLSLFYNSADYCYHDEWLKLFVHPNYFDRLRLFAVSGLLTKCRFRSICWRLFLGVLPEDKMKWIQTTSELRSNYFEIRQRVKTKPKPASSCDLTDRHPLALSTENPWNVYYMDKELRAQIKSDLRRLPVTPANFIASHDSEEDSGMGWFIYCLPVDTDCFRNYLDDDPSIHHFFHMKNTQKMMKNILFCCAKQNSVLGYYQGMHDILAVVVWTITCDQQAFAKADDSKNCTENVVKKMMNGENTESDAYAIFCQLMKATEGWLGSEEFVDRQITSGEAPFHPPAASKPCRRMNESRTVIQKLWFIHDCILRHFSSALVRHLHSFQVYPPVYGYRWILALFAREFHHISDVVTLWDGLFGDGSDLDLVDYICVALLLKFKERMLQSDLACCATIVHDELPDKFDVHHFIAVARQLRDDYLRSQLIKSSSWEDIACCDTDDTDLGPVKATHSRFHKKVSNNGQVKAVQNVDSMLWPKLSASSSERWQGTKSVEMNDMVSSPKSRGTSTIADDELSRTTRKLSELQTICSRCADSIDLWTGKLQNELAAGESISTDTLKLSVCGLKEASFKMRMAISQASFFHLLEKEVKEVTSDSSAGNVPTL